MGVVVALVSVVAYVYVGGLLSRVLPRIDRNLVGLEGLVTAVWPLTPFLYLMTAAARVAEWCFRRVMVAGQRTVDLPGRLLARWRRRGLHDDCVASWAWMAAGGRADDLPHGPCTGCEGRLRRLSARELPRAVAR